MVSQIKPSSVREMTRVFPKAVCVQVMLKEYARQHGSVNELMLTRQQIAEITGIARLATVSKALRVLHDHSWIRRETKCEYSADRSRITRRWISITFLRNPFYKKDVQ